MVYLINIQFLLVSNNDVIHYHFQTHLIKVFFKLVFNYFENLEIKKFNVEKNEWVNKARHYNIKCINGFLISIAGLSRLYKNLTDNTHSKIDPICIYRLNLDCLENFFGTIRNQNYMHSV